MLIRVRTNAGMWRVDGLDDGAATVQHLFEGIKQTRPNVEYTSQICRDAACKIPLTMDETLQQQGLRHGSMIYCRVNPATTAEGGGAAADQSSSAITKRVIQKDGSIQMVAAAENEKNGFRKGCMALRDIKKSWTLADYLALDSQYEFKIQRQATAMCGGISLSTDAIAEFQSFLVHQIQFSHVRVGYLYGTIIPPDDNNALPKIKVEAIYEPPQEPHKPSSNDDGDGPLGFVLLEDEKEEQVDQVASWLGMQKVGWIVGHPPREDGFVLSAHEVITAAELQLEHAATLVENDDDDDEKMDTIPDTPFCTVRVTVGNDDAPVVVDAFQVSRQCMSMVAEEALQISPDPGFSKVNETFTAIQEGKPSKSVNNNFFLTVVPIEQHASRDWVYQFPKLNRISSVLSKDAISRQLSKSGKQGWTFRDLLADFHLLLYLANFMDANDIETLCQAIVNKQEIPEGYKVLIAGIAGMDGSY